MMKNEAFHRTQFTFYASYLKAVEELPKCRRFETLLGIIRYGLDGVEPELSGAAACLFAAVRPHLDNGRSKAAARLEKSAAEAAQAPSGLPGGWI